MKTYKLKDMHRGWVIGNFEPSILQTDQFEVGVLNHKKGEVWPAHIHKEAVEYNILLEGEMIIKDTHIKTGDIFVFEKNEVADPNFLEDCKVLCVKVPSVPGDKYEVL
tara:strand:+ start:1231 stop:1554 length:324 start_codon:yes stop_codon:yes gene_type:complete